VLEQNVHQQLTKGLSLTSFKAPLIYFPSKPDLGDVYEKCVEVSLLGAYQELYIALQGREFKPELETVTKIGFNAPWYDKDSGNELARVVFAIEKGRRLARDLGGADPERMVRSENLY
jgi:leucyl aminopeptidase